MGANNPQIAEVISKNTMAYFKRNTRFLATDLLYASGRRVRENIFPHRTTNATFPLTASNFICIIFAVIIPITNPTLMYTATAWAGVEIPFASCIC